MATERYLADESEQLFSRRTVLSHERTLGQLIRELDHVFGLKVELRRTKGGIFYLEGPAGEIASVGDNSYSTLMSPRDQEVICENFGLDATLLGLNPRRD